MQTKASRLFALGTFSSIAVLAAAYYLEYVEGLEPCLLCMVQRVAVIGVGLFFFLAWITPVPRFFVVLATLTSSLGIYASGRQLWLQSLPADQVPLCGGATAEYLLNTFPFVEAISMILQGSGECAEVQWTFLGLTIPGWSMVFFCFALLLSLSALFARNSSR